MARRFNKRFAGYVAGGVVGAAALVFIADKVLIKPHPDEFVAAARDAESQRKWDEAMTDWQKAVAVDPEDPMLWTQLGNATHMLGRDDPDFARRGRDLAAWQRALEINPDYVPAVKALVAFWRDMKAIAPSVEVFRNARDRAEQLLRIAPNDPDVLGTQAFLYTTTIDGWLAGLETDQDRIDQTEQQMRDLMVKVPSNSELPFYLALLDLRRAQVLSQAGTEALQPDSATAMFQKAAGEMETALRSQENNPAMHFHAAQIYSLLAQSDHSSDNVRDRDIALADQQMDKATANLKGTEPNYVEISLGAARTDLVNGNTAKAQAVVRALLKRQGGDPTTVMAATTLIQEMPDLLPIAIDTLETALSNESIGVEITARRYQILADLVELQVSEMDATDSDAVKAGLKDKISHNLQQMGDANRSQAVLAHAQARFEMSQHDFIGTIQTINRGMSADPRIADDPEMIWLLARAYAMANEHEQAEEYMLRTVLRNPAFLPARKMLVEMLSADGTEESRRQISQQLTYLLRAAPDDPDVIRLEMLQLDPKNNADQIKALYARLPEKTIPEMRGKAFVAIKSLEDLGEGERLLEKVVQANPSDLTAVLGLARVYASNNQRPQAMDVVNTALTANPNNPDLQLVLKELEGTSPADLRKFRDELVEQNKNPLAREMELAQDALANNDVAGGEQHLKAAEKIDPNNKEVWNRLFAIYSKTRQWDKAEDYIQKLGAANYDEAHGLLYEFQLAKAKGDTQRELEIGAQLTNELPEFAMSYYCLGQALQATGQWRQAIDNFDTAMQKKGIANETAVMLKDEIDCYYELNQPDRALMAIGEGRRRFPDDSEFAILEVRHRMNHGDPESAVSELQDMLRMNQGVAEIWLELAQARMEVAYKVQNAGDQKAADQIKNSVKDLLTEALKKFPDNGQVYSSLADSLRIVGDYDGAEKILLSFADNPKFKGQPDPQVLLGRFYGLSNQLEKAETAFRAALALSSDNPDIRVQLADVLTSRRKFDEALSFLTSTKGDEPEIRRQRVLVLVSAGRDTEAEAEIKTILDQNPPDASHYQTAWGQLELNAGHLSEASDHINKALALNANDPGALMLRAKLRMAQPSPDADGALADLSQAHAIRPDNMEVLSSLADVYTYRFDAIDAAKSLEAALRIEPADLPLRLRLVYVYSSLDPRRMDRALAVIQDGLSLPGGKDQPELVNALASVYQVMGRTDDALQVIASALGNARDNLPLQRTALHLLSESRRYNDAIDSANSVINAHPDLWWTWHARGEAKAGLGDKIGGMSDLQHALALAESSHDTQSAIEVVRTIAVSISPDSAIDLVRQRLGADPQWNTCLVLLYHSQGNDVAAIQALEPLLAFDSKLPGKDRIERLQLAGSIYSTASPKPDSDRAYATYKDLLTLTPNNVQALNNFACLCADNFQPPKVEEGLVAIRRAIDILNSRSANDPTVEDTYGWLLILGGQTQPGIDVLNKVVQEAVLPESYYHLAEGYLRMNQPDEAQRQVNLALQSIAKAQQMNQPVDPNTRLKIQDLSNRVLDSLRTSGSVP
jgi:tetratricopeptide (TPR) repeat protein